MYKMIFLLLVILTILTGFVYLYIQHAFSYWKKKGLPYLETSIIRNLKDIFLAKRSIEHFFDEIYTSMKVKGHKHIGGYFLTQPMYVPIHPDMIKSVLVKDFQYFYGRGFYCNEKYDPLSAHLFALDGEKWKNLRNKLSPTFTTGKLKKMFQTLVDCSDDLATCLNEPISKDEPIDIKLICQKYTINVIGSVAFGIDCNSFKYPDTDFIRLGRRIFLPSFIDRMKFMLVLIWPAAANLFRMRVTNKEVQDFFMTLIKDTVEYRENNNVIRNDFLQLLIDLKNRRLEEDEQNEEEKSPTGATLTMNELSAQAFIFFAAGFETSSTTMTYCLYELAKYEEIQEKLRREIVEVLKKHDGKITYEAVSEMAYLDQVISETLRKYPAVPFLRRIVTQDFEIPETKIVLDKDTVVTIPVFGLHQDAEFYPNPDVFDPDRFTSENKAKRPDFTYLPFGDGPRFCIGLRFGILQAKVGMCQLLKNYKFKMNPKTEEPLSFYGHTGILTTRQTIWLTASRFTE